MSSFDWLRDELILALDAYFRMRPAAPAPGMREVRELSELLRKSSLHPTLGRPENFRSPASIVMKLMNFRSLDATYGGSGLSAVSNADRAVWAEFSNDQSQIAALAAEIRKALTIHLNMPDETDLGAEASEGRILTVIHHRRERSAKLGEMKKRAVLARNGRLECEACGFSFGLIYGERGADFIECHHTVPLSELAEGGKTRLEDLALVCSNCHRMIHSKRPWLDLEELRSIIRHAKVITTNTGGYNE
jgi:5-methylcytosine-specific restriction protein A